MRLGANSPWERGRVPRSPRQKKNGGSPCTGTAGYRREGFPKTRERSCRELRLLSNRATSRRIGEPLRVAVATASWQRRIQAGKPRSATLQVGRGHSEHLSPARGGNLLNPAPPLGTAVYFSADNDVAERRRWRRRRETRLVSSASGKNRLSFPVFPCKEMREPVERISPETAFSVLAFL